MKIPSEFPAAPAHMFAMIDGKRHSHTIHPKTGLPVQGITSVTFFCPQVEIADAMATSVMVMGITAGLDMINQMEDVSCTIIDDDQQIHSSKNIN